MLGLSLHLAYQVLGAALPEDCRRRIQADPVIPTLAAQVRARLFTAPAGGARRPRGPGLLPAGA